MPFLPLLHAVRFATLAAFGGIATRSSGRAAPATAAAAMFHVERCGPTCLETMLQTEIGR